MDNIDKNINQNSNNDKIIADLKAQIKSLEQVIELNRKEKELILREHKMTVDSLKKDIARLKVDNTYMPLNYNAKTDGAVTKKEFKNMTYNQRLELYNNNKEKYNELAKSSKNKELCKFYAKN